ncbi:hypothetical protein ABPG72_015528 [Tetrahymena utriculariae]
MSENANKNQTQQGELKMSQNLNKSLSNVDKQVGGRRIFHFGSQSMNKDMHFSSNFIKTSKYTVWNFFPLCLLLQFKRYANVYFLIIAILQSIPAISPLNPLSAWAPLVIVIGISMAREGYEDYQRYKSDLEMNSSTTTVYRDSKFITCKWGEVLVGDLVKIVENETFPSDIIVLNTSNEGGVCFIETSSLDGEKNYKNKEAMAQTLKWVQPEKSVIRLVGQVNCILPNENLHQFEGTIQYHGEQYIVGAKQFLLRGAKLKNTKWIAGIIVYTGEDTKIMKNADKSKYKVSNIESHTNKLILAILIFQLIISICSAVGNSIWNHQKGFKYWYIPKPSNTDFESFLTFLTYIVLNNTMIPISLIVSLEIVKLVQGYLIASDEELVQKEDGKTKLPKVYTTSINEELGQVQYIFSDKTGTLTCNKMELKLCCIGNQLYGDQKILQELSSPQKRKRSLRKPTLVDENSEIVFYKKDENLVKVINGIGNFSIDHFQMYDSKTQSKSLFTLITQRDVAHEYLMLLATCHECVIEQKDQSEMEDAEKQTDNKSVSKKPIPFSNNSQNANTSIPKQANNNVIKIEMGQMNLDPSPVPSSQNTTTPIKHSEIKYQGPSPDEVTLVDTARHYGYVFLGANSASINLEVQGEKVQLELLKLFEFNSDRKRMSVVVRHNGLIKMYIKGADNKIKERLNSQIEQPFLHEIQEKIDEFSKKGLRTLLVAMKILEENEYKELDAKYQAAGNAANREEQFFKIAEEYEKDLYLIGATAVEDKLQDRVPETIRDMLLASNFYFFNILMNNFIFINLEINVWMLTGDKMETAENIAKSCKLIQSHFKIMRYHVNKPPIKEGQVYKTPANLVKEELNRLFYEKEQLIRIKKEKALLIEGEDLGDILQDDEFMDMLIATVKDCESVVCCRATPKQKAQVVKLVKDKLQKITLAIGDGANDVNMIQEAHIGIGLFGQEGMRAVQASDYALPEFKGLWRLLLVHGRWNYLRISEMILYFFYKNFIFTIPQFFFSFSNGFSGQSIFDDYYITLYNIVFTAFPLLVRAVTEQDLYYKIRAKDQENQERLINHDKLMKLYPKAYYVGQQNLIFNTKNFLIWIAQALVHASIIYAVVQCSIQNDAMSSDGLSPDLWVVSITLYSAIILVVDVKLAVNTRYWTKSMLYSLIFTSLVPYFLYIFIANLIEQFNVYLTAQAVFTMPDFYLIIFFSLFLVVSFDILVIYLKEVDYRGFVEHLRSLIKERQNLDNSAYIERLDKVDINNNFGRDIPSNAPVERKYEQYAV